MANIVIDETNLDNVADQIVTRIDEDARDYDHYEYGIPLHGEHRQYYINLVKEILKNSSTVTK